MPLIPHEDIDRLPEPVKTEQAVDKLAKASLDIIVKNGMEKYPQKVLQYIY